MSVNGSRGRGGGEMERRSPPLLAALGAGPGPGPDCPEGLRAVTGKAFLNRWSGFLAVAAQRSFAASLLGEPLAGASCVDGAVPDLSEVLDDSRFDVAPDTSRLPGR